MHIGCPCRPSVKGASTDLTNQHKSSYVVVKFHQIYCDCTRSMCNIVEKMLEIYCSHIYGAIIAYELGLQKYFLFNFFFSLSQIILTDTVEAIERVPQST